MRILVIGSRGAMGKRYCAILKYLGIDFEEYDILDGYEISFLKTPKPKIDKAIIATPIDAHYEWCLWCIAHKIDFLCEKPISKSVEQIENLKMLCERNGIDGRMVCNWEFLYNGMMTRGKNVIHLNYYNTGKDGFWDLIQPVYLANNFHLSKDSPVYNLSVNGEYFSQKDFDLSYVVMVREWLTNPDALWGMSDAIKATQKVIEWGKKNGSFWSDNSGS